MARNLVGKRDGGDLRRTPRQQRREPRGGICRISLGPRVDVAAERDGWEATPPLAVPMLAILKIISDRLRPLKALGHFLEGE